MAGSGSAGGKGWNLGRLHRYGFPVPDGGVLGAEAYRLFLSQPGLAAQVAGLSTFTAADATQPEAAVKLSQLRSSILAAPLPFAVQVKLEAFLAAQGLVDRPVAVRSSATSEDSASASFAGIHQSFLDVTGLTAVAAAVRGCYASLWTPQAVAYRRRLGLTDDAVAAAVVILAMVPAEAAGVCFTCDPKTGRRDRFAISATAGLGEALVSGQSEPDEYAVDVYKFPPVILSRQIGRKIRITVARAGGGTELADLPAERATRPALTDALVAELTMLAGRVQDALGEMDQPQDIEWAHDGERFWLVQARPVTTLPAPTFRAVADQPVIWSNANLRDVLPGVTSELGWSFMRSGMEVLLTTPLANAGWQYEGGMAWVRLFAGRAYFNLSAMQWAYYDSLGMEPAEFNQILGGHQPELTMPAPAFADRMARSLRRLRTIALTMKAMKEAPATFKRYWDWAEEAEHLPYDTWPKERFLAHFIETKDVMEPYMPIFQTLNGAAGAFHSELIKLITPVFGARAVGLVNAMLAGSQSITSAEQGTRLVELGNQALQEAPARAWFSAADWQAQEWAERLEGTRFKAAFADYLRDYGHRGVYEVEVMNPRWKEDPTYLLETIRSQVLAGREIRLEGQTEKRAAASREVFGKLGFSPRGWQARYYWQQAGIAAGYREMGKSVVVKLMGVVRAGALALGRRMAAEGVLEEPGDIFHLTWMDVEAYVAGRPGTRGLKLLVADRKARRTENLAKEPPDIIIGEQPVKKAPPPTAAGPVLTGTGVASGRASGMARVILHPDEGTRLQPGEILVAPSTDPAWTPLFLRASAVVMEIGGYLSHGAIVAREYGLPAVANVPGLLQTIKDGEPLTVDGDTGKVYRQAETNERA